MILKKNRWIKSNNPAELEKPEDERFAVLFKLVNFKQIEKMKDMQETDVVLNYIVSFIVCWKNLFSEDGVEIKFSKQEVMDAPIEFQTELIEMFNEVQTMNANLKKKLNNTSDVKSME